MKFIIGFADILFGIKGKGARKRILAAMMAIVVFCTTYALILPAITLESTTAETEPGIEEDGIVEETFGEECEADYFLKGQNAEEEAAAAEPETEEVVSATETSDQTVETEMTTPSEETETETEEVYAQSPLIFHCDQYDIELSFDSEDW